MRWERMMSVARVGANVSRRRMGWRRSAPMVAALVVFALSSLLALGEVQAEDPRREFRFEGRAVIDGEPVAKGTPVQIRVAGAVIASSQVQDDEGHWSLDVNAELLAKGVCDAIFYVGGHRAERQWNRCTVNIVLEVGKPVAPLVPPGDDGDPPDDDDPPTDPPGEGDPPTDPPDDDDPPTDPPGDGDPPTDPPGDDDPPTDPPGDGDPPTDPPGEGDPPTDPPADGDPPTDPPDDDDPPTDPPGDGDPPGGTEGDGDPPTDPPGDTPPGETEGQDGEDDASATNRQPTGERPQTPPRTGTGGLHAESQGSRIWLLGLGAALGTAFGLALLPAARRFNDRRRGSA